MADQSDPIEISGEAPDELSKAKLLASNLDEMRHIVGQYAQVKDLVLHPGWPVLITALEKRMAFWKERCAELLELILVKNDGTNNSEFSDARVHYRAAEEAIYILLIMRKEAREAQEFLDKASSEAVDSQQNG